ncbi:c-type cytochrome [Desulfuromonas versatilis]|uniref:C-type cytochrome n=1 Tax=Desulfuromonas versatilis TaxID=2802975 RepID=A0ABM8HYZ6_9BACT|nr:cytochrome c [Desulfuromonas versatilis]BCR05831.1 c-type cytochrome [Desulfuromonas versatilis]
MRKRYFSLAVAGVLAFLSAGCINRQLANDMPQPPSIDGYQLADAGLGGQLYDDWPRVVHTRLSEQNPLYPRRGEFHVTNTYRCKSCHGWDFSGNQWSAGDGGEAHRVRGRSQVRELPPGQLYQTIARGPAGHAFGDYLTRQEVWALVRFIREELIDPSKVIAADGRVAGDAAKGRALYEQRCADCHGSDGRGIDLRRKDGVQGVGWRVAGNPVVALHRVRWGRSSKMHYTGRMRGGKPSGRADLQLSDQQILDILAYCSELPKR